MAPLVYVQTHDPMVWELAIAKAGRFCLIQMNERTPWKVSPPSGYHMSAQNILNMPPVGSMVEGLRRFMSVDFQDMAGVAMVQDLDLDDPVVLRLLSASVRRDDGDSRMIIILSPKPLPVALWPLCVPLVDKGPDEGEIGAFLATLCEKLNATLEEFNLNHLLGYSLFQIEQAFVRAYISVMRRDVRPVIVPWGAFQAQVDRFQRAYTFADSYGHERHDR